MRFKRREAMGTDKEWLFCLVVAGMGQAISKGLPYKEIE